MEEVNILDVSSSRHINLESMLIPQKSYPIQIESFGLCIESNGNIYYGMQIESINNNIKDSLIVSDISRTLVAVRLSLIILGTNGQQSYNRSTFKFKSKRVY